MSEAEPENQLAEIPASTGALAKNSDALFEQMASPGDFFPRLQLITNKSRYCDQGDGTGVKVNHFGLFLGKEPEDVGDRLDCVIPADAWRPKALYTGDGSGDSEFVCSHDPESEAFRSIRKRSEFPDSKCQYGPEFLIYLPEKKKFVTFFCGSKSQRREADKFRALQGGAVTLSPRRAEKGKFVWYVTVAQKCTRKLELPTATVWNESMNKFRNPATAETKERKPVEGAEGGRVR